MQSSVSLQHLPYDAKLEKNLPAEVTSRLAFATQKLEEIVAAAKAAPSVAPVPLASAVPVVGMRSQPVVSQGVAARQSLRVCVLSWF